MSRETSRGRRPFKVWDSSRVSRKALVVSSLEELIVRGREKLGVGGHESVKAVLETDGTQVDDSEYFRSLPDNTVFLLLRPGERWCPAGVDVIRAALSSIPRIVCEAISSLDLQNEVPSWKIMESRGRITIVLTWDQRPPPPGPATMSSSSPLLHPHHHAPPLSTTHTNDAFARRVSPLSLSPQSLPGSVSPQPQIQSYSQLPSLPGPSMSRVPMMSGVRTMITKDGKLETTINGRGIVTPSITVISHEESPYDSVPLARSLGRLPSSVPPPLPPHQHQQYPATTATQTGPFQYSMRGLPRQGSSSLESTTTTATAPIHVHTVECAQRGHLPPHPPHGAGGRGSPPDSSYCDFHCCALHEEGRKIQVHKAIATSPIDHSILQDIVVTSSSSTTSTSRLPFSMTSSVSSAAAAAAAAKTLHVRFMGVGEDKNGRSMYVSKKLLSVPGSALAATNLAGAHQHHQQQQQQQQQSPPINNHHHHHHHHSHQTLTHLPGFTHQGSKISIGHLVDPNFPNGSIGVGSCRSSSSSVGVGVGVGVDLEDGTTTTTESSESETENNSTLLEDDIITSSKFLLLIDQLSLDQKRHLTIKDIGIILDRLSSKILDVERLDRESEAMDCFNWTIKATIRGDALRELGVIYNGNYYAISEHPSYITNSSTTVVIPGSGVVGGSSLLSTTTQQTRAQVHITSGVTTMSSMTTTTRGGCSSSTTTTTGVGVDDFEEEDMRL